MDGVYCISNGTKKDKMTKFHIVIPLFKFPPVDCCVILYIKYIYYALYMYYYSPSAAPTTEEKTGQGRTSETCRSYGGKSVVASVHNWGGRMRSGEC